MLNINLLCSLVRFVGAAMILQLSTNDRLASTETLECKREKSRFPPSFRNFRRSLLFCIQRIKFHRRMLNLFVSISEGISDSSSNVTFASFVWASMKFQSPKRKILNADS
jgi:hypothetical protein